ncbi:MAG: UDP-N-acetylmuramoyl-L-alanyl-D-glutamate--2,6-diaminopimelate ligase [Clostridia bacterium]|nr:UDP-N-acetylmuramoyl-L-alanyl-D-glutamate--2,6-diaminopimelate ligase [Clostridia bacterium]
MKLSELLTPLGFSAPGIEVDAIIQSTIDAGPNTLFVCIKGLAADGHELAPKAYEKGCRAFIAEHPLALPADALCFFVPDSRAALASLAATWYHNPSRRLAVVGVTGTKGKTTTAELLAKILCDNGIPAGYIGTNGISYGDKHFPTANTTPDPLTLQKALFDMAECGMKAAIIEVSSQAIVQHRVDGINFSALLFTNFYPDHIGVGEHPDLASYQAAKHKLFAEFEAETILYNADDPAAREIVFPNLAKSLFACSTEDESTDFFAKNICFTKDNGLPGLSMTLLAKGETADCKLSLPGMYNAKNALLAAACAKAVFGVSLSDAAKSLAHASVTGRAEWILLSSGAHAVIDYAHNGESLRQLLLTLREYRPERLICLFGSVGGRTQIRRQELGEVAASLSDLAILTSDNPGEEDPTAILLDIANAFVGSPTPYKIIPDRREAILYAVRELKKGDILVLAGKGQETYQLIGKEKIPFSEREILKEADEAMKVSK